MPNTQTFAQQQAAVLKSLNKKAEAYTPISFEELTANTDAVSARIVFITPAIALEVMGKAHAANRALSLASKDAYLADMIRDRWEMNGEALAFDTKGKCIQGQHRLFALADTAKALPGFPGLPFVVVFGLPTKVQETMDAGRKRSVADQLNIGQTAETKLGTKIVAALRALYLLGNAGSGGPLGGGKLTNAMLMDLFKNHKDIVKSVELVWAKGDKELSITMRPAVVAAIHYIANNLVEGQADKADAFLEVIRTGVPTPGYPSGKDPAHKLYTVWARKLGTKRPSENEALKMIAGAWELYSNDKTATDAFLKTPEVPIIVEPIGITLTDVTGEAVKEAEAVSQPTVGAKKASTEAERAAALAKSDKALADKKAAATKAKADKAAAKPAKVTKAAVADPAPAAETTTAQPKGEAAPVV